MPPIYTPLIHPSPAPRPTALIDRLAHVIAATADDNHMPITHQHAYVLAQAASRAVPGSRPRPVASGRTGTGLTFRELQVVDAAARGLQNQAIGAELGVSDHTVKSHLARAMRRLHAADRAQAVAVALRLGLLPLDGAP